MADDDAKTPTTDEDPQTDDFGIDQKRMAFTDHLVELRYRIIVCLVTVAVAFFFFFFLFRQPLFHWLTLPVRSACASSGGRVKYDDILFALTPTSMFVTSAYFCVAAAVVLTIPVLLYQAWAFIAPGLKRRERRVVIPVLSVGTVLFVTGVMFAYFVVVPAALSFLMLDTAKFEGMRVQWNVSHTLKFESVLLMVFGAAFEMPLVVVALTRVGILSPELLARKRRHAIVVMFVLGALLTPPDWVTQVCLAVPLVILLEISIIASRFFRPKRMLWEAWDEKEAADSWDEEERQMQAEAAEHTPEPAADPAEADDDYSDTYDYTEGGMTGEEDYYGEYNPEDYDEDYEDEMAGYDQDWTEDGEPTGEPEEPEDEEAIGETPVEEEPGVNEPYAEPAADEPEGEEPDDKGGKSPEKSDEKGGDSPDKPKP